MPDYAIICSDQHENLPENVVGVDENGLIQYRQGDRLVIAEEPLDLRSLQCFTLAMDERFPAETHLITVDSLAEASYEVICEKNKQIADNVEFKEKLSSIFKLLVETYRDPSKLKG